MAPNKLSQKIELELLPRLNDEFNASLFYRAASNWCENEGYNGAAKYFAQESEDELKHAKGIENYLIKWNIIPKLPTIQKPEILFTSLVDIFNQAYQIEFVLYGDYNITSQNVFKIDISTFDFLQEYRDIQTKSVAEYSDFLNTLALIDPKDRFQLFYWEKENFK